LKLMPREGIGPQQRVLPRSSTGSPLLLTIGCCNWRSAGH